jgi:hypothetical protein
MLNGGAEDKREKRSHSWPRAAPYGLPIRLGHASPLHDAPIQRGTCGLHAILRLYMICNALTIPPVYRLAKQLVEFADGASRCVRLAA